MHNQKMYLNKRNIIAIALADTTTASCRLVAFSFVNGNGNIIHEKKEETKKDCEEFPPSRWHLATKGNDFTKSFTKGDDGHIIIIINI